MAGDLTRDDVFAACQTLVTEGLPVDKITGHAAWSRLGRGSKSTVQKYWKEWRALQDTSSPLTRNAAVIAIQETIDRLVDQAVAEERHRVEAMIAELEDQVRQLSRGLASALADAERVTAQLNEATAISSSETESRKRAEAERDWLNMQLTQRDEDLVKALVRRQYRDREMTEAAGRLAAKLPRPAE